MDDNGIADVLKEQAVFFPVLRNLLFGFFYPRDILYRFDSAGKLPFLIIERGCGQPEHCRRPADISGNHFRLYRTIITGD